jgi:ribosome-associated protein
VLDAIDDKKGEDVITIDVAQRTILAEHFVIVSGRSNIQTRAIADGVIDKAKENDQPPLRMEGYSEASWILIDFGTILVHVFTAEQRAFYNLERLWGGKLEPKEASDS